MGGLSRERGIMRTLMTEAGQVQKGSSPTQSLPGGNCYTGESQRAGQEGAHLRARRLPREPAIPQYSWCVEGGMAGPTASCFVGGRGSELWLLCWWAERGELLVTDQEHSTTHQESPLQPEPGLGPSVICRQASV